MAPQSTTFTFFDTWFSKLDTVLTGNVTSVAAKVVNFISPTVTALMTVYFILWGWSMWRGLIQEPIMDGVFRMLRLAAIIGLALNVGLFSTYLGNLLWGAPDALAAAITGNGQATTSTQWLDRVMGQFYDLYQCLNDAAHVQSTGSLLPDLGLLISGWSVLLAGILLTGYAAVLFSLAKIALSVLLGFGPLFVACLIFHPTQRFFEAWLNTAINFVLMPALAAGALRTVVAILSGYLSATTANGAANPSIMLIVPALVFALISLVVLLQVPWIASSMAGGVAVSTLGSVGAAWALHQGAIRGAGYLASGNALADLRAGRRRRAINARWAANNPSLGQRAASASMAAGRALASRVRNLGRNAP